MSTPKTVNIPLKSKNWSVKTATSGSEVTLDVSDLLNAGWQPPVEKKPLDLTISAVRFRMPLFERDYNSTTMTIGVGVSNTQNWSFSHTDIVTLHKALGEFLGTR